MAWITFPVLVFLALAACVAMYNTITMINSSYRGHAGPRSLGDDDGEGNAFTFDPLIKMPDDVKRGPKRLFHILVILAPNLAIHGAQVVNEDGRRDVYAVLQSSNQSKEDVDDLEFLFKGQEQRTVRDAARRPWLDATRNR